MPRDVLVVLGTALVLASIGLLSPFPYHGRGYAAVGDLCHTPLFMAITFILLWACQRILPYQHVLPSRRWRSLWIRCVAAVVLVLLASVMIEVVQDWVGRSASWHDVGANAWGIVAGALLHAGWYSRHAFGVVRVQRWWPMISAVAVAIGFTIVSSQRPLAILRDVRALESKFPMLSSFETVHEFGRWYIRGGRGLSRRHATDGKWAAVMRIFPGPLSGFTLHELHHDWSAMHELVFDVAVDDKLAPDSLIFVVQVVDGHDTGDGTGTFVDARTLQRGQRVTIRLPLDNMRAAVGDRRLDLTDIRYLDIQVDRPTHRMILFLDNVRLE